MTFNRLAGCATALPPNLYSQQELLEQLQRLWGQHHHNPARAQQLHAAVGVGQRHLALPKERYAQLLDFTQRNAAYVEQALPLAEQAITRALQQSGTAIEDVDYLVFTSVTGLSVPSLDARLMNRLPFKHTLKRLPMFGWGCLGGAAGTARLHDLLKDGETGLLLSAELCSLTLQPQDISVANLVATGLFGDGAAALVMSQRTSGPKIVATRSAFFPESEHVMGWDIGSHGFGVVLSPEVPHYAEHHLAPALTGFLQDHGLEPADIGAWVAHPGGPKVIDALQNALELPASAFEVTRRSLREVGNLSSASVLFVLSDVLSQPHPPGTWGLMLAMGPAFAAELLLLQW